MKPRNLAGLVLIATVFSAASWLIAVSPGYQSTLHAETLDRPTAITCVWSQPWADPAFVLDGWSQPQPWWHQPEIKVLWSNARTAQVLFHTADGNVRGLEVEIKYPSVSTAVAVQINGKRAGMLDGDADGNHDSHVFRYRLSPLPDDGVVDIRFLVGDATLHPNDGRYLGVLLQAVRSCPVN